MLDERGVEYVVDEEYGKKYPPEKRVTWSCDLAGEDMTVTARDYCIGINEDGSGEYCLDLEFHEVFTVEQAIAATLGATDANPTQAESSGTCRTARRVIVADPATDCATGFCTCGNCGGGIDPWDGWCRHCGARMEG
jgi:hypothetical protein